MGTRYRPPRPKSSAYITPQGAKKLRDELDFLWTVDRPQVTKRVADAAAEGDRSENAEYIYGKKRLRQIDSRIHFLSKRLAALTVVEPTENTSSTVFFGAYVRLEDGGGNAVVYRIVGPDESDHNVGAISMDSPVGKSLLGKEEGDKVKVKRPKGTASFEIVDVSYTPFEE
jgi:transcription elongation factor GreB